MTLDNKGEPPDIEQRIERLHSYNIRVHVHTADVSHEAQAQHVGAVSHFPHRKPVAVHVARQGHLDAERQGHRRLLHTQ
jgi:hypothetical protein